MNSAQDVLNGGLLTPFTVARPSPPTTKEGAAAQREEKLKEQERAAAGRRMATQSLEETKRAQRRQLEGTEAYRTRQLMEIEGERPLPVSLPEFQSPRKTGEEMIGLLLVNAFATSALGKQNYLAAANAMTGAIKGYEAGKKTEYEQALKDFDVAVRKAVQEDKVNTAKYLQIANSKKMSVQDKFNLMRQEALRLDDKIMAAQLNTQQWDKVVAEIDRRLTAIDNTEREINREERRRVERAEERAERRAERAVDRAERGATGRTAQTWEVTDEQGNKQVISIMPMYDRQGNQINRPPNAKPVGQWAKGMGEPEGRPLAAGEVSKLEGLDSLANELEQLKKDFKPEYASLGILGFGANLSLEAKRRLGDKEGQKAVSWWSRYDRAQAPNRHALFGATFTKGERESYEAFTAKKSDDADVVKRFLDDQLSFVRNQFEGKKSAFETTGYKVPRITPRSWGDTFEVRRFNSVEEAERANLPPGTRININGRNAVVE